MEEFQHGIGQLQSFIAVLVLLVLLLWESSPVRVVFCPRFSRSVSSWLEKSRSGHPERGRGRALFRRALVDDVGVGTSAPLRIAELVALAGLGASRGRLSPL